MRRSTIVVEGRNRGYWTEKYLVDSKQSERTCFGIADG